MDFINSLFGYPLGWIMWLCYTVITNFGIALILFTIISKAIMFPLSIKQQRQQAKMAYYQPQIDQIKKQYSKDRERQQQEIMKFYSKEKLSMTSGCLPMLIQFPILFGVIDVVYKPITHILHFGSAFGSTGYLQPFLDKANEFLSSAGQAIIANDYYAQIKLIDFIKSPNFSPAIFNGLPEGQALVESVNNFSLNFLGMNLGSVPNIENGWYWLIPIISGLSALIVGILSMKLNSAMQVQGQGAGMMKGMMLVMPVISFFIATGVPAGVGIYWTISNIASLGQTILLKKMYNPEKYKAQLAIDQTRRKEEEKEKNKIYVESKVIENGEEKIIKEEVIMSKKEKDRLAIKEARRRMAEKYGDVILEDDEIKPQGKDTFMK